MTGKYKEEFVFGALLGGAIGAVAALLLTPISGAEIRKQLSHGLNRSLKQLNGQKIKKAIQAKIKSPHTKKNKKPPRARQDRSRVLSKSANG